MDSINEAFRIVADEMNNEIQKTYAEVGKRETPAIRDYKALRTPRYYSLMMDYLHLQSELTNLPLKKPPKLPAPAAGAAESTAPGSDTSSSRTQDSISNTSSNNSQNPPKKGKNKKKKRRQPLSGEKDFYALSIEQRNELRKLSEDILLGMNIIGLVDEPKVDITASRKDNKQEEFAANLFSESKFGTNLQRIRTNVKNIHAKLVSLDKTIKTEGEHHYLFTFSAPPKPYHEKIANTNMKTQLSLRKSGTGSSSGTSNSPSNSSSSNKAPVGSKVQRNYINEKR